MGFKNLGFGVVQDLDLQPQIEGFALHYKLKVSENRRRQAVRYQVFVGMISRLVGGPCLLRK